MTWSVVARYASGCLGIAIASRFFAVGALCPYVRSGVGAVATQALVNPHYGPLALDALSDGKSPAEAIASELREKLAEIIDALPPPAKSLIRATYFEGVTMQEAGRRLGISKAWASRLHARTLEPLARSLRRAQIAG